MTELILKSGKRAGKHIPLPAAEVVIGRDEGCHIRLTSSDISRRHCLLRNEGGTIVVSDLGSRNGTHVNDRAIKGPTTLRPGDLLRVGPFLFQVPGREDDHASDAEIGGWLTEEGTVAGAPPANVANDTTLIPDIAGRKQGDTTELQVAPVARPVAAAPRKPAEESHADPAVEQAADAIRQYWAGKKKTK